MATTSTPPRPSRLFRALYPNSFPGSGPWEASRDFKAACFLNRGPFELQWHSLDPRPIPIQQSGAPSHKYWIEMHFPSSGHRSGSKAGQGLSAPNLLTLCLWAGPKTGPTDRRRARTGPAQLEGKPRTRLSSIAERTKLGQPGDRQ